ncbi:hypothetical protein Zmor_000661 [Zophobas morio]|uniref:Uncharacterized protein n=1 Tax=Zophobas morio TaxID=2755281 RepID=A0AA38J1R7_9CUCU|nr:hypothetical protein Zmor_000661 [Zophobas morio]
MTTHAKHTENELKNKEKKSQKLKIASWDVQETFQEGALRQFTLELQRYDIATAAIQKTKQKGNSITEIGNYIFFNSGNANRMLGTGFLVRKNLK